MSRSTLYRLCCSLALCAATAFGQEFELDLSEEKAPAAPPELRPTVVLVAVTPGDAEEVTASRAKQLEAEVLKQLGQDEQFQTVLDPAMAKQQLGEGHAAVAACTAFACFDEATKKLKVHRAVRFVVTKQGVGSVVNAFGFDPALNEVVAMSQDSGEKPEKVFLGVAGRSQAMKDRDFMKKMAPFIGSVLKKLATPNGKIIVDNAEPSAVVSLDGASSGTGSVELIAQRGARTITVTGAGYKPFEQTVTVEPLKTAEVKVTLVALPLEVSQISRPVAKPEGTPIFKRPGLYVALAGAAAVAAGIAVGQGAQAVKTRLEAGGTPVQVTRAEAKAAEGSATLANVLVGVGAAAAIGGVTWIILTPTTSASTTSGEPTDSIPVSGWMLGVGGSF